MEHSRRRISALAAVAVALLVGGLLWLTLPASAASHNVTVENFAFNPATITVQVGDSVTWTNQDAVPHTVTADDGSFDKPLDASGGVATITFTKAGTFTYHCTIHPSMHGTVVVEGQQAATPTAPATPSVTASPAPGSSATPAPSVTQTPNQACTLTVKDFTVAPGSNAVLVPDAHQVDPGYVVIHESTSSGGVGGVIGWSAYLPGGSNNQDLVVHVDRPLVNGETVWPMLHTEGNGNHTYDSVTADPPTFSTKCGNTALGNMATFPAKVTVSGAAAVAPEAPSTGSGVAPGSNSEAALFVILGGFALALAIGSGALVVMRRHNS